jgi:hypothetical protein
MASQPSIYLYESIAPRGGRVKREVRQAGFNLKRAVAKRQTGETF